MITPQQIRSARALVGLTQAALAKRAGLSTTGLNNIERGVADPKASTLRAIQSALEAAGVEFMDGGGVKPRRNIDHEIKLAREWIAEMDDEPKDRPARTSTTLTSKTISDRRTLNLAASAGVLVFAGQSDAWRDAAKIFLPMPVQPKPV